MQAFVTGGTGFVGANLVRPLLQQGYKVRALVRANSCLDNLKNLDIEIVRGDLNQDLTLPMKGCQVLFHVAAQYSLWQTDKDALYRNNVLGTRNILQCARQAKIERTVYTSSVAAIGVRQDGAPADETYQSPVDKLIGDYKKSKYYAEQEAVKAVQTGQDIVIVNPSTPIGALDIKPTPTGEIIVRFLQRRMPFYVDTGLNLIDVEDVGRGHILALEKGKKGDRYILGNHNLTFAQLLGKLEQITGLSAPKNTIPYPIPYSVAWLEENILRRLGKQPTIALDGVRMSRQKMFYNPHKAVTELGLPQSDIDDALRKAVKYFQAKHNEDV